MKLNKIRGFLKVIQDTATIKRSNIHSFRRLSQAKSCIVYNQFCSVSELDYLNSSNIMVGKDIREIGTYHCEQTV